MSRIPPQRIRSDVCKMARAMAECPVCEAKPGSPCVCCKIKSKLWGKPIGSVHAGRVFAWHELGMPLPIGRKKLIDVVTP